MDLTHEDEIAIVEDQQANETADHDQRTTPLINGDLEQALRTAKNSKKANERGGLTALQGSGDQRNLMFAMVNKIAAVKNGAGG